MKRSWMGLRRSLAFQQTQQRGLKLTLTGNIINLAYISRATAPLRCYVAKSVALHIPNARGR
jgi:hypothetical protein